ncbi:ABC transporter substrate-binding protein [Macrococcus lamae]|uniref:ABC transporter substrate-binding protein n=1 Tax=Macrococcus lamae TaxID=198484 RepID=A0A4R6BS60_9STAP|nr:ABC transporter substrate-binding protein [Macrococcus lamae]TDM05242.1 ABC transporter substrate-binding protein [Macrococcus lamae]
MKQTKLLMALLMVLSVVLAACGGSSESSKGNGGKDITFWAPFSGPDGPNMKKIVEEYNKSQKDFNVKLQIVPQNDYYKTVDLALNGKKDAPEVMIMHGDQIRTYAEKKVIQPLDGFIGNKIKKDDYHKNAWNGTEVEGKLYGVPLDIHPLMFYYNKDLFKKAGLDPEKAPTTGEEFVDYAKKLTDGKGQYGFVVPTLWPQQFIFPTLVYQNGGKLIENDKVDYTNPAVVDALQFEKDLIFKDKVSPENVQQDGELTMFLQGKNAMTFNGPWMMNQFDKSGINYGVAPVPQFGDKEAVYANSHNFVIPTSVKDKDVKKAIENFVAFAGKNSMEWAKSGQAPAIKSVYESDEFNKLKQQPQVAKSFDKAMFSPNVSNWGPVSDPLYKGVNEALLGKKSVEDALKDAADKSQKAIK